MGGNRIRAAGSASGRSASGPNGDTFCRVAGGQRRRKSRGNSRERACQVDTNSATVGQQLPRKKSTGYPRTRTFQSIALTAPSLTHGDIEGGIQVNGASGAENAFHGRRRRHDQLDQRLVASKHRVRIHPGSASEDGGFPAEYGGALGGVISAVTKSGGQYLHRRGSLLLRGSPLKPAR